MGKSCELKLRKEEIGWASVQSFWQWCLLAESGFPLLWSVVVWKPRKWACSGFVKLCWRINLCIGNSLTLFFSSNSSWNSADTHRCEAVREADSHPSLHKLSSKMQMTALFTHPPYPPKTESPLLGYSEQVFIKWVAANRFKHLVLILPHSRHQYIL